MDTKRITFQLPEEKALLNPSIVVDDLDGIFFAFMSDMQSIASILPPMMEPVSPIVNGYIVDIRKPSYSEPYMEAMLAVAAKMGDTIGVYPISFLLSGDGAEMGTYMGREELGLPKKVCDAKGGITLDRDGNKIRGIVERKGVRLMDVSVELGEYNNPMAGQIFGEPEPGKVLGGPMFFFKPYMELDGKGNMLFTNVDILVDASGECKYNAWTPGKASIRLQSSAYDAWGQLPITEILGAAHGNYDMIKNNIESKVMHVAATVDAKDVIPFILTARYDGKTLI